MADTMISAEFLGADAQERLSKCRQLAAEVKRQAEATSNPENRRAYLELKRQWDAVAADIEAAIKSGAVR